MKILKRKTNKRIISILLILVAIFAYSLIEPYWIEEKTTIFESSEVPENFQNLKIVFVSDIHSGPFISQKRIAGFVEQINAQNPDIVVLGGDFIEDEPEYITPCFEELKKLKAKMGIYAVIGNHDAIKSYNKTYKAIKEAGITPIENDARWIEIDGQKIKLGGVTWSDIETPNVEPTTKDASQNDFVILASHVPDFAEELQTDKVDLMLSGHTHGGQVTLFGLFAPYIPSDYGQKYRTGIIKTDKTTVLVSNGLGTSFLPIRFFARPQINIIILKNS